MDFDAFIREVEAKTYAIWMEELQDVRRLRLGVVRSGAGTNGQLFNALLFAQSEVRGLTINVTLASGERVGVGRHLVLLANTGVPALLRPHLQAHEVLPGWNIIPQMLFVINPEKRRINHLLGHKSRRLAVKQLVDGTIMISGGQSVELAGAGSGLRGTLSATALNVSDAIATFPFLDRSEFLKLDGSRAESCAIDQIPIIGKIDAVENMIFGFAWCGHGCAISLGFATYLADWITSGEEPSALAPFSPRRFRSGR